MNLRDRFAVSLIARASEPALGWQGATYTFGDIGARSNRDGGRPRQWRVCPLPEDRGSEPPCVSMLTDAKMNP
jgi:hypothetical protein